MYSVIAKSRYKLGPPATLARIETNFGFWSQEGRENKKQKSVANECKLINNQSSVFFFFFTVDAACNFILQQPNTILGGHSLTA